jgi:rare lipoprotein A
LSNFKIDRHRAAASLLLAGTLALFGAQHLLGSVASAETTQALVEVHQPRPLATTSSADTSSPVTTAATPSGQFEDVVTPTPAPTLAPTVSPAPTKTLYESGVASTYGEGDGFEGNRTACGQIFHTAEVQIAHKSLPCGTHVLVEDASSGRTVEASVTDRGPYIPGRVVDLSWGAFRELDPTGPGLLQVNVYLLDQQDR